MHTFDIIHRCQQVKVSLLKEPTHSILLGKSFFTKKLIFPEKALYYGK